MGSLDTLRILLDTSPLVGAYRDWLDTSLSSLETSSGWLDTSMIRDYAVCFYRQTKRNPLTSKNRRKGISALLIY